MIIIGLLLQAVICGFLASNLAGQKGHSSGSWFAIGFFLGIFGLIAAAGLPTKAHYNFGSKFQKKCPDCAELIRKEALVCKFCGKKFTKDQVVADLIAGLQGKSMDKKIQALDALRVVNDPSVVPHIIKFLDEFPEPDYADDSTIQPLKKAVEVLREFKSSDISSEIISIIKKDCSSEKSSVLIESLGLLRDPLSIPFLIELLQDFYMRDVAAKVLEKYGQAALSSLEQLSRDGKESQKELANKIIERIKKGQ